MACASRGEMNSSQFGNYVAGYAAQSSLWGNVGTLGTIWGGEYYAKQYGQIEDPMQIYWGACDAGNRALCLD